LREDTGEGRSKPPAHLEKNHYKLFHSTAEDLPDFKETQAKLDNTTVRLFGKLSPDHPPPKSKMYSLAIID